MIHFVKKTKITLVLHKLKSPQKPTISESKHVLKNINAWNNL